MFDILAEQATIYIFLCRSQGTNFKQKWYKTICFIFDTHSVYFGTSFLRFDNLQKWWVIIVQSWDIELSSYFETELAKF